MEPAKIGHIKLKNYGWFTTNMGFRYIEGNKLVVVPFLEEAIIGVTGHEMTVDLGDIHVKKDDRGSDVHIPAGRLVWLVCWVEGGVLFNITAEAQEVFVCEPGNLATANYVIDGTTITPPPHLHLEPASEA